MCNRALRVYFEVKDINCPPPAESVWRILSHNLPIRTHVEEGQEEIQGCSFYGSTVCARLVRAAGSFVHMEPYVALAQCTGTLDGRSQSISAPGR